jgi:pimeloyl-ACP methyl ester carboxylesterase
MPQQPEVYGVLYKFLNCDFDLYFADYRGTGKSHNLGSKDCVAADGIDVTACASAANKTWGDKLHHFSVTAIAKDFDRLIPQFKISKSEKVFTLGYSWGTYVSNRLLQVMAARGDGLVYLDGMILDAVCTPGLCKALNIGVNQDRSGRMLLSRYCARDSFCAEKLGGDPEMFAAQLFERLDAGTLPCAEALALQRTELQTLLNTLAGGHWPQMRLSMVPAFLYRLRRCSPADLLALNHSVTNQRASSAGPVSVPPGTSIVQELNMEYSDHWMASLGGRGGEALVPSQASIDSAYETFMFADNNAKVRGFNAKTTRPGFELWNKFPDPEGYVGKFGPPLVPMLLLNGDVDQAVNNDGDVQQSVSFYGKQQTVGRSRNNVRLMTIPYAGHTTLGQSPVRCSEKSNPLVCSMQEDGVGINGPFAPACGAQIAMSFIDDTSGFLNTSCLLRLFPLDFAGRLSLTQKTSMGEFGTEDLWGAVVPTPAPTPVPFPPAFPCPMQGKYYIGIRVDCGSDCAKGVVTKGIGLQYTPVIDDATTITKHPPPGVISACFYAPESNAATMKVTIQPSAAAVSSKAVSGALPKKIKLPRVECATKVVKQGVISTVLPPGYSCTLTDIPWCSPGVDMDFEIVFDAPSAKPVVFKLPCQYSVQPAQF